MTGDHDDDDLFHSRWRRNATGETSKAAAPYMNPKAPPSWDRVLSVFHPVGAIRLRFTELKAMRLVCHSGTRRIGEGGRCKSVVWRATTEDERQQVAHCHGEKGSAKAE